MILALAVLSTVKLTDCPAAIDGGILAGLLIAYAQAAVSIGIMAAALKGKKFLWAWSGSFFFRLFVFCATAYITYTRTRLNLAATLLTLVGVTTVLLALESWAYLSKGHGQK